jgi:hypothetical protein
VFTAATIAAIRGGVLTPRPVPAGHPATFEV